MTLRFLVIALIAGASIAPVAVRATPGPGSCPSDSKLLNDGPTSVFGNGDGTFWGLVIDGLNAAGFDQEAEKIAYLNQIFGTSLATLADLKAFNLQQVSDVWDKNQNGYVCAFELRGTRAYFHDPLINLTFFGISDDRVGKN